MLRIRNIGIFLPQPNQFNSVRLWHDRSQVPRIVDDRRKRTTKFSDTGYFYRYHREGIEDMPRIPDCKEPLFKPKLKVSSRIMH
jgi:hypothetical protein